MLLDKAFSGIGHHFGFVFSTFGAQERLHLGGHAAGPGGLDRVMKGSWGLVLVPLVFPVIPKV